MVEPVLLGASVELMSHSRKIQGLPRHQAGVPPCLAPLGPCVTVHTARGWGDVHSADLEAGLCPPEALPSLLCSGAGAIPVYLPAGALPGRHVCSVGPAWSFSGWSSSAVCRGVGLEWQGPEGSALGIRPASGPPPPACGSSLLASAQAGPVGTGLAEGRCWWRCTWWSETLPLPSHRLASGPPSTTSCVTSAAVSGLQASGAPRVWGPWHLAGGRRCPGVCSCRACRGDWVVGTGSAVRDVVAASPRCPRPASVRGGGMSGLGTQLCLHGIRGPSGISACGATGGR